LISKPRGAWHRRWAAGALVVGSTTALLAAPFAGTALAAAATTPATAITVDQSSYNVTSGGTVHITGTYTPTNSDANIQMTVASGPDANSPAQFGSNCVKSSGTYNCSFTSANGPGTDTVTVYADNDGSNTLNAGDVSKNTTVNVGAATPVTAMTVAQNSYNTPVSTDLHITGTYTPTTSDANFALTVTSGPDTQAGLVAYTAHGSGCTTDGAGNYDCTFNSSNVGTDTVRVFADNDGNSAFTAGEPFKDVTVVISGAPFSVTLSPDTATTPTGNCQQYTVTATDSGGRPSVDQQIDITISSTGFANGGVVTTCAVTGGSTIHGFASTAAAGGTGTSSSSFNVTTNDGSGGTTAGQAVFGITSNSAGSSSVKAASHADNTINDTSTQTWTAGGVNAVSSLSASPSSATGYTTSSVKFTVTAKDSSGNALNGVPVFFGVTSGPDSSSFPLDGSHSCGSTAGSGTVTCTINNTSGNAGTDNVEFWVNQTSGTGPHTNGPDSGEPTTTASAVFQAPPTVTSFTVTCPTPGSNATPSNTCDVPVDQTQITFTATAKNGTSPVSGAVVTWNITGSATSSPTTGTSTTDANGVATFTVTVTSPTAGQTVTAAANIGNAASSSATATYRTRAATTFTLTPPLETVTEGGSPAFVAKVVDQFGTGVANQSISWVVSTGRNAGKTGNVTTGSDGTAAITYTDTGVNPGATTDHVIATDNTGPLAGTNKSADVNYITGSTTASAISADVSGNGTSTTCPATSGSSTTKSVALNSSNDVCAIVKNSSGQALAGKTVTISVSKGTITAVGNNGTISSDGKSATEDTNSSGIVTATVTSGNSGDQTVTFTADSASGSGTITYGAPANTAARNISIAPKNQAITPGGTQRFTATVVDVAGNPVPNVSINFTQSGPGSLSGGSSSTQTTDANGQASVTLSTSASDSGSGSVTATITTGGTQCTQTAGHGAGSTASTPAGNCADTAPYTVAKPPPPPSGMSLPAYRTGSGNFFRDSLTSGAATSSFGFGNAGDVPLWGDWNGDGTPSIGVFRPSNRTFYLSNDNKTAAIVVTIGNAGDLPAAGDFDGNGTDSIALFRPSTGQWFITNNDHSVASSFVYGTKGDRPLVGDWFGQGVSKVGVYRPSTGQFFRIGVAGIRFGNIGDTPTVGDWDGNGTTTIGVIRGTTWFVSNNNASAATSFSFGVTGARFFTWSKTVSSSAPTSS